MILNIIKIKTLRVLNQVVSLSVLVCGARERKRARNNRAKLIN